MGSRGQANIIAIAIAIADHPRQSEGGQRERGFGNLEHDARHPFQQKRNGLATRRRRRLTVR
jgi:hypothetical protein